MDKALRKHGEYERIIEELEVELLLHEKVKGDVKITFTAMVRDMTYDYCATSYKNCCNSNSISKYTYVCAVVRII